MTINNMMKCLLELLACVVPVIVVAQNMYAVSIWLIFSKAVILLRFVYLLLYLSFDFLILPKLTFHNIESGSWK